MLEIREEDVKRALRNGFEELEEIHKRILALHDELMNTNLLIQSVALKSPRYGSVGSGSGLKKDLTEIMIKHEQLTRQRGIEIREELRSLTDDEETINRIKVCFQTLRGKEYSYLYELYVCGHPYKAVEKESGVSHRTFEKIRKSAMQKILQMYASSYSNQDIIKNNQKGRVGKKKRCKEKENSDYQQLKLKL